MVVRLRRSECVAACSVVRPEVLFLGPVGPTLFPLSIFPPDEPGPFCCHPTDLSIASLFVELLIFLQSLSSLNDTCIRKPMFNDIQYIDRSCQFLLLNLAL
jgi:hypothetical protein